MRTKLGLLLAAMLLGTALASLVPTASAQQVGQLVITLNAPTENVKPLQSTLTISGTATLTVDQTAQTGVIGIPVQFSATGPAWASLIVSPAQGLFAFSGAPGGQQVSSSIPIQVTVTASQEAPALTPATIEVSGVTTQTPGGKSFNGKGTTTVTAEYFGQLSVELAQAIRVERPQTTVTFPLKVTNLGNGNTKVTVEKVDPIPEGYQTAAPVPTILTAKQTGGNTITADIPLDIQTPYKNGYMNQVGVIAYKITSNYALDPKKRGDESAVSVVITTRGFYVPGPSPIVFVGLVGLAAVLLRRRE